MSATAPQTRAQHHPHLTCHLGVHTWTKIRDDEGRTHYACRYCDRIKVANEPWWEFASEAGTGFH